jgi:hypothetical protein
MNLNLDSGIINPPDLRQSGHSFYGVRGTHVIDVIIAEADSVDDVMDMVRDSLGYRFTQ